MWVQRPGACHEAHVEAAGARGTELGDTLNLRLPPSQANRAWVLCAARRAGRGRGRQRGAAGWAMPARRSSPQRRRREPRAAHAAGKEPGAHGPPAAAGRARAQREPGPEAGRARAPRFRRRPRAGGRARGAGRARRRRARETRLGSPAARAGRSRTKMSAGEKINPCVAAAALPLHSSPALSPSLLPRPRAAAAAAARAVLLF